MPIWLVIKQGIRPCDKGTILPMQCTLEALFMDELTSCRIWVWMMNGTYSIMIRTSATAIPKQNSVN